MKIRMIVKVKKGISTVFLLLMFAGIAFSQNPVIVKAPHGGIVQEAGGNYFIETLLTSSGAYVFLLDEHMKAIGNKDMNGNVVFRLPDGTFVVSEFIPYLSDGFALKGAIPPYLSYIVNFDYKGRRISATFTEGASEPPLNPQIDSGAQ